ncbi:MAG: DNA recombination protein RmuC, partial [Mariprofundaceae bacterium]|nr:DNA recombination protein RmuC [Mariprofundaceae bacterium]
MNWEVLSEPVAIGLLVFAALLIVGWVVTHLNQSRHIEAQKQLIDTNMKDISDLLEKNASLDTQVHYTEKQISELEEKFSNKETALYDLRTLNSQHEANIAGLNITIKKDREAAVEKLALLEDAKEKLGTEFKLLANQIFEERGKAFSEQNKSSLDEVLKPMREQLGDFRTRVDEVHVKDAEGRASLTKHLEQLEKLNRQMSEDAVGLTQALKGDSKAQGNWGEMILERILETSGLREGKEFAREQSFTAEDGRRLRPDVVIYMPGDKQVIIDSKVSLTDYERVVSATDDGSRKKALTAHLKSLKSHIQGLSSKRYDHLPNVNSPDYVLMFIPIEGAYLMAI